MQEMIANRIYDTDAANALGNWQRGYRSERGYLSETLYQNEDGTYFLHCAGGPRSRYAQRVAPNTWSYGERILPMSHEEAHAWAENHLTEAAYDTAFGECAKNRNLTLMLIRLKTEHTDALNKAAAAQGRQPSELAEELLAKALEAL